MSAINQTPAERVWADFLALLQSIAHELAPPPEGTTWLQTIDAIRPVTIQLDEVDKVELEEIANTYWQFYSRKNLPFFIRIFDRHKMRERFFAIYEDARYPIANLMAHMRYDINKAQPMMVDMSEDMMTDEAKFGPRVAVMERPRKDGKRYAVRLQDWEWWVEDNPKMKKANQIYEFLCNHSLTISSVEHVLNAAWNESASCVVNGVNDTHVLLKCDDVTWDYRCEKASWTADGEMDEAATKMWLGLFDKIKGGRHLLYCFLRYARQERIPGLIFAGKSGAGKSIMLMLFQALKKNGANISFFSSDYEDAGATSLIACEEYSPKKHPKLDVNVLKNLITNRVFSGRQIYEAESKVIGNRYVILTDNWDKTPLERLVWRRTNDEESVKNRLSVYKFEEQAFKYLRDYDGLSDIIDWTVGATRIDPTHLPFAVRFAKYLDAHEKELFAELSIAKDSLSKRTGIAVYNSDELHIDHSEDPIQLKLLKLYIEHILLKPVQESQSVDSHIHMSQKSVVSNRGWHYFKVTRRFRRLIDHELKASGILTYNTEHGDLFEKHLYRELGQQVMTMEKKAKVSSANTGSDHEQYPTVRYTIMNVWAINIYSLLMHLRFSQLRHAYSDLAKEIIIAHRMDRESERSMSWLGISKLPENMDRPANFVDPLLKVKTAYIEDEFPEEEF